MVEQSKPKLNNPLLFEIQSRRPDLFLSPRQFEERFGVSRFGSPEDSVSGEHKRCAFYPEHGVVVKFSAGAPDSLESLHQEVIALDRLREVRGGILPQLQAVAVDQQGVIQKVAVDYIPGKNGDDLIYEDRRKNRAALLGLLGDIHAGGVYVTDIKPRDIVQREDGIPVIVDFGEPIIFPPFTEETLNPLRNKAVVAGKAVSFLQWVDGLKTDFVYKNVKSLEELRREVIAEVESNGSWRHYKKPFGSREKAIEKAVDAKLTERMQYFEDRALPELQEQLPDVKEKLANIASAVPDYSELQEMALLVGAIEGKTDVIQLMSDWSKIISFLGKLFDEVHSSNWRRFPQPIKQLFEGLGLEVEARKIVDEATAFLDCLEERHEQRRKYVLYPLRELSETVTSGEQGWTFSRSPEFRDRRYYESLAPMIERAVDTASEKIEIRKKKLVEEDFKMAEECLK